MPRLKTKGSQTGFSLLELLIAVTILGIVILVIGGAMRLGISSVEKGERVVSETERIRSTLLAVDRQVGALIPATHTVDGERVIWFSGDNERCLFVTTSSLWGRRDSFIEVLYSVEDSEEGFRLREIERLPGEEDGLDMVLLDGLEGAGFTYLSLDENGEPVWHERWEEKDRFPEAVAFSISGATFKYDLLIPLRAKTSTGTQIESTGKAGIEKFKEIFERFR